MSVKASGGSPVAHPQQYQSLPISVISLAAQQDRYLKNSEVDQLASHFSSGAKLLEIAAKLTEKSDEIVSAGASRIFVWGSPMAYLEKPKEQIGLPGSGYYVAEDYLSAARRNGVTGVKESVKVQNSVYLNPINSLTEFFQGLFSDREPLPGGFRFINVSRYGPTRMKRSMRDLGWFLRYVTYAIVAGDSSILTVNVRGLRGVIPEDVTEATAVAIKDMKWKSLTYFKEDAEATAIIQQHFDVLVTEYLADKPAAQLRVGVSRHQQGLQLPQSYFIAAETRPKLVMKSCLPEAEKQDAINAVYRQVFERNITATYGFARDVLESQVKSGNISLKEFVRALGKSKLYLRLFYEPFVISRVVELAMRHFLGRGLSSREEFQQYFSIISAGGLPALIDALVDSQEYSDYFGEETVPYLRGLGQEAQECRNWGAQLDLFKYSAPVRKVPQFVTLFGNYEQPLLNQHPYGAGNDPLEITFGAIFPKDTENPHPNPALFNKDNQRLLISSGLGLENVLCTFNGSKPLKLNQSAHSVVNQHLLTANGNHLNGVANNHQKHQQGPSVTLLNHSPTAVILGAYRQVFGRDVYEGQRVTTAEIKLKGGEITVREFVRQLAKSKLFRSLYWENLYITKAIEYIHRRLLGRPTYGRKEMNQYYDVASKKGFYGVIDQMVDSAEYRQVFGEDTVPYERYITPRGFSMRSMRGEMQLSHLERESPFQQSLRENVHKQAARKLLEIPSEVQQETVSNSVYSFTPATQENQEVVLTAATASVTSTSEENYEYS
jgi:phycobilisome core-membrane linker protein